MDRWQATRWIWTFVVIALMSLFIRVASTNELIDDTLVINELEKSYEVASNTVLTSGEWFAIRVDGELIPASSDGGYHINVEANQRWKLASYDNVEVTSPDRGYVQMITHAGTGEMLSLIVVALMFGMLIWICGGIFLRIFD